MASELNMYESQVTENKMDIDRLQRELQEVKKKYYLQKKKDHQQRWASCVYMYLAMMGIHVHVYNWEGNDYYGYIRVFIQNLS